MSRGRWVAVGGCTAIVAAATGLLYLVLYRVIEPDSVLRYLPYVSLLLYAAVPFCAAWLSDHPTALGAAAGGLALGIAASVSAAAVIERGGTGAMPLTFGVAIAGMIALRGRGPVVWTRLLGVVLVSTYAAISGRVVSVIFVYPLLGFADEFTDAVFGRRSRASATN